MPWVELLPYVASLLVGVAAWLAVATVLRLLASDDLAQDRAWRYDVSRINLLRQQDALYRWFQPLILLFARFNRAAFPDDMPRIAREIQAAGLPRFWTPQEYLGKCELIALLSGPIQMYAFTTLFGPPGAVMAVMFTFLTAYLLRRRLAGLARERLVQIKRRMPFMLDLITLLMEAGSTFLHAMERGVRQYEQHPVGQEFGRVLAEISMGKGRIGAFEALRDRLNDDEITSIVGSILQGEQLGTPLARLFRTQADVLRLKRSQRAETMAGEAGVKMLLPGVMVMASTVIIILGPFILGFLYSDVI
jgi:tight adherence protein C